jgi:uncharacterized protein (TIGR03067 family)
MYVRSWLAFCAFVTAGAAQGGDGDAKKAELARKELARLEGKWRVVDEQSRGAKHAPEEETIVHFQGDKVTVTAGKRMAEFAVRIDPAQKPPALDFTGTAPGSDKQATQLLIYRLEGDTLTLARMFGRRDRDKRPTTFEDKDNSMYIGLLKRLKP